MSTKPAMIWMVLGRMNIWVEMNQLRRSLLGSLIGIPLSFYWYNFINWTLSFRKKIKTYGQSCMCDLTMPFWCIQVCFTFPSLSYFPFPCLGLELNFKSRYFSPAVFPFFLFFLVFVRDNAALHESSGALSVFFECGSNHQASDSHKPPSLAM